MWSMHTMKVSKCYISFPGLKQNKGLVTQLRWKRIKFLLIWLVTLWQNVFSIPSNHHLLKLKFAIIFLLWKFVFFQKCLALHGLKRKDHMKETYLKGINEICTIFIVYIYHSCNSFRKLTWCMYKSHVFNIFLVNLLSIL